MKRFLIIAMALFILTGCSSSQETAEKDATAEDVNAAAEAVAVTIHKLENKEITSDLVLPGQIEAEKIQTVSALVSGQITFIDVNVGDNVKKGDVLVKLDDSFTQIQKKQAEIGNNMYQLGLDSARRSYDRMEALYKSGNATQAQFEEVSDYLKKAQLDLANGKVNLEQIQYQLDNMTIKAPMNGIVSKKSQQLGNSVAPGTPLIEIMNLDILSVVSGVTEKDVNRLKPEQSVDIFIPAINTVKSGIVKRVSPSAGAEKIYNISIEIENGDLSVKPGMYADVRIITESPRSVLSVPKKAIIHENGSDYVFVIDNNIASKRLVVLGGSFDDYFEVTDGLETGLNVVISGQSYLKDGSLVNVTN